MQKTWNVFELFVLVWRTGKCDIISMKQLPTLSLMDNFKSIKIVFYFKNIQKFKNLSQYCLPYILQEIKIKNKPIYSLYAGQNKLGTLNV